MSLDKQMNNVTADEKDRALKEREVAAREREVELKAKELGQSKWLNPTVVGLLVAALGLTGNFIVARINNANTQKIEQSNNDNTQRIERLRAQSNLILEAIKTNDPDASCNNLRFLVDMKLLNDGTGTITDRCAKVPPAPPTLPVSAGSELSSLPARVYFRIAGTAQTERAQSVAANLSTELSDLPLRVPRISLANPGTSPGVTELRFDREVDRADATLIARTAAELLNVKVALVKVKPKLSNAGADRPRHFELWWSPDVKPTEK